MAVNMGKDNLSSKTLSKNDSRREPYVDDRYR